MREKYLKCLLYRGFASPISRLGIVRLYVLKHKMLLTNANMTNACSFPNPCSFVMLAITVEVLDTSYLNMTYQFNPRDKIIVLNSR